MIKARHGGKIINIASTAAVTPVAVHAPYNVSKSGVAMLTKSMALDLATNKILVNAVAPGGVQTPGSEAAGSIFMEALGMTPEQIGQLRQSFQQWIILGRLGEPDDIVKLVLFLASGAADYMTGQLIVVDGGYLLA